MTRPTFKTGFLTYEPTNRLIGGKAELKVNNV
jgi:hypothetical protein